jgi:hypothetical protein
MVSNVWASEDAKTSPLGKKPLARERLSLTFNPPQHNVDGLMAEFFDLFGGCDGGNFDLCWAVTGVFGNVRMGVAD